MSIICKFFKRITVVFEIDIWSVLQWTIALFERLNMTNWNLSKVIISDWDRKFLSELWFILFAQLKVKLLYFTVYHFQTDDASKRTNQILKIVLKFLQLTIFEIDLYLSNSYKESLTTSLQQLMNSQTKCVMNLLLSQVSL